MADTLLATTPIMAEIQNYIDNITLLAEAKNEFIFKNSSPDHACAVITTILNYADQEVFIYDTSLDGTVCDRLPIFYPALYQFLRAGKTLKMVLRSEEQTDAKAYKEFKALKEKYKNKLLIKKASDIFTKAITNIYRNDINFTVSLPGAFRMEEKDKSDPNVKDRAAICSFNRPEYAKTLSESFANAFNTCPDFQFA